MFRASAVSAELSSLGVLLLLCVSCGGRSSDGSNSGKFSSTVPGDQQLGTISDDDESTLCSEFIAYSTSPDGQQIKTLSCQVLALLAPAFSGASTDADLQRSCKASYDTCTAGFGASPAQMCTKAGASCTATVADLEACLNDSSAYYASLSRSLPSCATVKLADLNALNSLSETPPPQSCATYESHCPSGSMPPGSGSSAP